MGTTRHNGLATEFGLTRDPARWGAPGVGTRQGAVHAESEAALLYALRPPWVPNDLLAHRLLEEDRKGIKSTAPAVPAIAMSAH